MTTTADASPAPLAAAEEAPHEVQSAPREAAPAPREDAPAGTAVVAERATEPLKPTEAVEAPLPAEAMEPVQPTEAAEAPLPAEPLEGVETAEALQAVQGLEAPPQRDGQRQPALEPDTTPLTPGAAAKPAPEVERRATPAAQDAPEPVSQTTRRFLKPLVAIDPDEMRLHRGETAAQLTSAHAADAVTIGRDVFLAPGEGEADPAGIGLLGHELTHVAASQAGPAFLPPLPASATSGIEAQPGHADTENALEELDARQVEANVRSAAQRRDAGPGIQSAFYESDPADAFNALHPMQPVGNTAPSPENTVEPPTLDAWNGMPAPWEPLPDWLTTPAPEPAGMDSTHAQNGLSASMSSNGAGGPPMQMAEQTRDLPPPDGQASGADEEASGQQAPPAGVEPDLDALARQVYTLLRRRLASERRRFG